MAISALEIQRRRLTVLTVLRCVSLIVLGYAFFAVGMSIIGAISYGVTGSTFWTWTLMYLIAGSTPFLFAWFVAPKLGTWLVPVPAHNACGACGYGLNETDTQCSECGLKLLPEPPAATTAELSWYRRTILIGTPILRVVGLLLILGWCSQVASQMYWHGVGGLSLSTYRTQGLSLQEMQLIFGCVEPLTGLAMLFKGKAIVTLMVPKPHTLRKKRKPENA